MGQLPSSVERYLREANIDPSEFTSQERIVLNKILLELERTGKSKMLESLWMEDYDEVPVSIDRFISDEEYIGGSTNNGNDIYPYWKNMLNKVFSTGSGISEVILSGAIGVGKSSVACIGETYTIYKLLCLKNPSKFYNLISTDSPAIALFNITLDKGYGVAYKKIQEFCINSPWFTRNGSLAGRGKVFIPDKGIKIGVGSGQDHFIGLDIFSCLTGDTIVITENGASKISELEGKKFRVWSVKEDGFTKVLSDVTTVACTNIVSEIYEITLSDNGIIRCTWNHLLLIDNEYREARSINVGDRIGKFIVTDVNVRYCRPTKVYDIINANPYNNFLILPSITSNNVIVSHNCFMDEMDFADNKDVSIDKSKVYESFQAIVRRINTRFMSQGDIPGVVFLASSVRTERDFLATHIEQESNNPKTLIVREPIFNIKPSSIYSGEKFKVAIGTKFSNSYIVKSDDEESYYRENNFNIYEVPIEYKQDFEGDINSSVRDILGVALKSSGQFISKEKIEEAINDKFVNGFLNSEIQLGFDDETSLFDYFDLNRIDHTLVNLPIFVHFDLSVTGDKTGMYANAAIDTQSEFSRDSNKNVKGIVNNLMFFPIFGARISPLVKGEQIPYYKLRDFVIRLRDEFGLNIVGISCDGYQSVDMLQNFKLHNFYTAQLSMDRAPSLGYKTARTALNEGRVIILNDGVLKEELERLEENRRTEKVDHPAINGSKDEADAWAGSIYNAVLYNEKNPVINMTRTTVDDILSSVNGKVKEEMKQEDEPKQSQNIYRRLEDDMFNFSM